MLLQRYGVRLCDTEFGRHLGGWPFEFRLRLNARTDGDAALLRLLCDAAEDRVVLLLGQVQIIDRRRELHLTQQEVAAASGLHQSVVSRIEQGVANPTARALTLLARALDAQLTLTGR